MDAIRRGVVGLTGRVNSHIDGLDAVGGVELAVAVRVSAALDPPVGTDGVRNLEDHT